jgi:hypothetical protein
MQKASINDETVAVVVHMRLDPDGSAVKDGPVMFFFGRQADDRLASERTTDMDDDRIPAWALDAAHGVLTDISSHLRLLPRPATQGEGSVSDV